MRNGAGAWPGQWPINISCSRRSHTHTCARAAHTACLPALPAHMLASRGLVRGCLTACWVAGRAGEGRATAARRAPAADEWRAARVPARASRQVAAMAGEPSPGKGELPGLSLGSPWNQKALHIVRGATAGAAACVAAEPPRLPPHAHRPSRSPQTYPPLKTDLSADVVVVGAGIAGLSCAYNLARAGGQGVGGEGRVREARRRCRLAPQPPPPPTPQGRRWWCWRAGRWGRGRRGAPQARVGGVG